MSTAAWRPCAEPRCPALVPSGRCPAHAHQQETRRPNRDVRRWYYTARWARLRVAVLLAACHTCTACGQVCLVLDVDHVIPHRGDPLLFWDRNNLQALCKSCHSQKTTRGL